MTVTDPVPERYELACAVDPYRSGWTLERFLGHRFRYHPPEIWRERIDAGAVRVNGEIVGPGAILAKGDRVEYTILHAEPAVDFAFDVLHEDDHVLAVSKSGNLPVHAGGKFIRNTLIARLRQDWGRELRLAHRLDRETSGIVLLAKTKAAARALELEFRERRVEKRYVAIVRGEIPAELVVDAPIARREPVEPPYPRVVDRARGKAAVTRFERLAVGSHAAEPGLGLSLVAAVPEGGRTNQIRVHAAHAGHPILGDKIYGIPAELAREYEREGESERIVAAAGAPGHLLHCARLRVRHPAHGEWLGLEAPVPERFRRYWRGPEIDSSND